MKKNLFVLILMVSVAFAAFETLGEIDARSVAAANADAAYSFESSSCMVGNPAFLGGFEKVSVTASASPRSMGLEDSFIINLGTGAAIPIPNAGGVGVFFSGMFVNADSASLYNEIMTGVGYGHGFVRDRLKIGLSFFIQKWNVASDAGVDVTTPLGVNANLGAAVEINQEMTLGLTGRNLLPVDISSDSATDKDTAPTDLKLGFSYDKETFLVSFDTGIVFETRSLNFQLGAETYFFDDKFRLGGGLKMLGISEGIVPSLGFGYGFGAFTIDYALQYPINIGGAGTHLLSFNIKI